MKKLVTLLLAAGLVFGSMTCASAVEFNAKGWWWMAFDYAGGGDFTSKTRQGVNKAGSRQQAPTSAWTILRPGIASCSSWTPRLPKTSAAP